MSVWEATPDLRERNACHHETWDSEVASVTKWAFAWLPTAGYVSGRKEAPVCLSWQRADCSRAGHLPGFLSFLQDTHERTLQHSLQCTRPQIQVLSGVWLRDKCYFQNVGRVS